MKTIEEIKAFITDFIAWEYKVKRSTFDQVTSKEQHFEDARYFLEHFYSRQWIPIKSGGLTTKPDGVDPEILKINFDQVKKRTLYIIRQYENSRFGKGILADEKMFFSCVLGSDSTLDDIEIYNTEMSVGVVDGNLKIIAERSNTKDLHPDGKIKWNVHRLSPAIAEGYTILDDGKLMATLRIAAPEWQQSLADYNID